MLNMFLTENNPEIVDETAKQISEEVDKVSNNAINMVSWLKVQVPNIVTYVLMIILALVIFFVGKKIIKFLIKLLRKSFTKTNMDEGVSRFLLSMINIVLHIILVVIIAGFLGLETTSLAALVGSAGLAVGLSLQGSLANFAGGVLILMLKPFAIGDYIVAEGTEGVVNHIDIFYTRLLTVDNKLAVIPNGKLSNAVITNVTSEPLRRVDITVGIEYSQDVDRVKAILSDIATNDELVLKDHPVDIYIDSFASSSVTIGFRVWTEKDNYWQVKWNMQESIKKEFDKNNIAIPFDQLDVNVHSDILTDTKI